MQPIDTTGKLWDQGHSNARLRQIQTAVKAELKDANADVIHATIVEKWAEFCAKPQDQAAFLKGHLPTVRNEYLADARAKRQAAEDAAKGPAEPSDDAAPDDPPGEFDCDVCGKPCTSAAGLVSHKRVHD